jgi:hypothetical protein
VFSVSIGQIPSILGLVILCRQNGVVLAAGMAANMSPCKRPIILSYVVFELVRSVIAEWWLKLISLWLLVSTVLFVLPMALVSASEATWHVAEIWLGVIPMVVLIPILLGIFGGAFGGWRGRSPSQEAAEGAADVARRVSRDAPEHRPQSDSLEERANRIFVFWKGLLDLRGRSKARRMLVFGSRSSKTRRIFRRGFGPPPCPP